MRCWTFSSVDITPSPPQTELQTRPLPGLLDSLPAIMNKTSELNYFVSQVAPQSSPANRLWQSLCQPAPQQLVKPNTVADSTRSIIPVVVCPPEWEHGIFTQLRTHWRPSVKRLSRLQGEGLLLTWLHSMWKCEALLFSFEDCLTLKQKKTKSVSIFSLFLLTSRLFCIIRTYLV